MTGMHDLLAQIPAAVADLIGRIPEFLGRMAAPNVSRTTVAVVVVIAIALAVPRVTWRWFGLFTTLVHELGHAFPALATGRFVHGIRIRADHSGSASSSGSWLSSVVSGFAGYPAPALVGMALIRSVFAGYSTAAFAVSTVIVLLTLLFIRNLFGVLVVVATAATSAAFWLWGSTEMQVCALLVLAVVLLVGGVRGVVNVTSVYIGRREELESSDAYLLFRRTGLPSPVWLTGFAAVTGWAVWMSAASVLGSLS